MVWSFVVGADCADGLQSWYQESLGSPHLSAPSDLLNQLTNFHENYVIARQPMAYFQISDKNMADE
jgi:hypothetical protein